MSSRILVKAVKKAWYDSVDSLYEDEGENEPRLRIMGNTRQSTLPEHDLTLDETTGWAGVEPVTALRVQGEEPAGVPIEQGSSNIGHEEGDSRLPAKIPKNIPADDDPTWNPEVESEWERDPVSGARYYYSSDGQKNFVDLKDAKSGTWATRPTMGDVKNVYTHNDPEKLVGIRGPIDRYGKVHRRDSNQANENLAEAFIEHDENIPPEKLVTVPLGGRTREIAAEDAGVPNLGYNRRGKGSSKWSDAVPPFNFKHGEPMEIAFQLLKEYNLPEEVFILSNGRVEFERAWIILKDLDRPDDWPPNYSQSGDEDANLEQREIDHVKSHSNEKFTPEPVETVPMPDGFFRTHAHERLTDRERTVNEDEEKEVRERITQAMQPYVDRMGNYNLGAPKNIAIRTHLLDGHRQPDEAYAKSNGDSIVGVVRPHPKNKLKPRLETAMLRRSELSHAPQPFKAANLRVDKVVNAHGLSKKAFKRLVASRRLVRRAEPMDIALQLLKERKSPEAWAHKLEYDKKYQQSPKRVKYREQLNAERRRRGIYGKGGADVSHTQGGKLTLESAHANRARHFKNRGTLRRVKVR